MTEYATIVTPRGGTFHMYHMKTRPTAPAQKDMAFEAEPFALVPLRAVDAERIQAEHQARIDAEKARATFEQDHQLTLV